MSEQLGLNIEKASLPPHDPNQLELDIGRASLKPPITAPGMTDEEDREFDRLMDQGENPFEARIKVLSQRTVVTDPRAPLEPVVHINPHPPKPRRHGRNRDGSVDARTLSVASRSKL